MATASATVAEEEYLQILFWLQEAGLPMTGANMVRAMQLSAPTVHEMVGRLERDGYITRDADRTITFTAAKATQLKRETVPGPQPPTPGIPAWVWVALSLAAILLIVLSLTIWKLTRRPVKAAT